MKQVVRGAEPADLTKKIGGETELERARKHFVVAKKNKGFTFSAYAEPGVRKALRDLFHGKCAYCEAFYDDTQTEDVEHFRPKGRIDSPSGKLSPGYWWLAATWSNLLPSCARCNRRNTVMLYDGSTVHIGKGNRFPIDDETKRARNENDETNEVALLINPCTDDPRDYLQFEVKDENCLIRPHAEDKATLAYRRASTSIDVYGLNRAGLVKQRSRYFMRLCVSLKNLELWIKVLDQVDADLAVEVSEKIAEETRLIAGFLKGDDAHTAMSEWLALPVLRRLGIKI
nr:retron system putative HNH endonuclease [Gluconobacter oxydans]